MNKRIGKNDIITRKGKEEGYCRKVKKEGTNVLSNRNKKGFEKMISSRNEDVRVVHYNINPGKS